MNNFSKLLSILLLFPACAKLSGGAGFSYPFGVQQLGGSGNDTSAFGVTKDNTGVYMTGYTNGNLDGIAVQGSDNFLVKYDFSGAKLWTKIIGGSSAGGGMSSDSTGVYVSASTGSAVGTNAMIGTQDIFVSKFDRSGNTLWTSEFGAPAADSYAESMFEDSSGIYVGGFTEGAFDGNSAIGYIDCFIVKLNPAGSKLWSIQLGQSGAGCLGGMVASDSTGVYVTGFTEGNLDGTNPTNQDETFITKVSPNGIKLWSVMLNVNDSVGDAIRVDATGIYVAGTAKSTLNGVLSDVDHFLLAKFDLSGNLLWSQTLSSTVNSAETSVMGLTLDASGLYVTGSTAAGIDGNMLIGTQDSYVAKYDLAGNKIWSKEIGVAGHYASGNALLSDGTDLYLSGETSGSFNSTPVSANTMDAFLMKLSSSRDSL